MTNLDDIRKGRKNYRKKEMKRNEKETKKDAKEAKAKELFGRQQSKERDDTRRINNRINNRFDSNQNNSQEKLEPNEIVLDSDFFYLTGALERGHVRIDPKDGRYRADIETKNLDWLRDSIKSRFDKKTGKENPIRERNNGLYRYRGSNKDLVSKISDFQNNPDKIRNQSKEHQHSWLNGYLDGKLTPGLKEKYGKESRIVDKDPAKLELAKDLMKGIGVNPEQKPKTSKLNPHLLIKGYDNHRNLRNNTKLENPQLKDDLDKISIPERFETKDSVEYSKDRVDVAKDFEELVGEILPHVKPDSKISKEPKINPSRKDSGKPDYIVERPDGTREAIDAKLRTRNVKAKDKEYSKHADKVEIRHLEGERGTETTESGKPIEYVSKDDMIRELKEAKEKSKSEKVKETIDKLVDKVEELGRDAKNLADEYFGRADSSSAPSTSSPETTNGNEGQEPTEDLEEKGGGGKEEKDKHPKSERMSKKGK